ncbi:MAG: response regulator [bacterium]
MTKEKILLVDDDEWLLNLYGERLKLEGFEVVTATNGHDGYELVITEKPDLILTDVVMSNGDGFYLLDKIRSNHDFGHIIVICLTNLASSHDFEELENAGANGILVKADYTPTQAVDKIKQMLDKIKKDALPEK